MTVGAAWIRRGSEGEELWIVSDSRLSSDGNVWDTCPKILPLPRRDAVAGFSGSTYQAYPLILQLANAIASYDPAADGTLEFSRLIVHLERVINIMMENIEIDPYITGLTDPNYREFATFGDVIVLGGYSRAQGRLVLRTLRYTPGQRRWVFGHVRPTKTLGINRTIAMFGDIRSVKRFGHFQKALLRDRGILLDEQSFDWEPLEILVKMLRMPSSAAGNRLPMDRRPITIGGAPQIYRVLPGAQATGIAVLWGHPGAQQVYLQGRPTFRYENLNVPLVEFSDSEIKFYAPNRWPERAIESQESGD